MRKTISITMLSAFLALPCGCGAKPAQGADESDDAGPAQDALPDVYWDGALPTSVINGAIGGITLTATSAIDTGAETWDPDLTGQGVLISSSASNLCDESGPAVGETWLQVSVIDLHADYGPTPPQLPMTVPVMNEAAANASNAPFIGAAYFSYGMAMCQSSADDDAIGGTVTLYSVGASAIAGAFDLDFSDGHVSGTFDAAKCEPFVGGTCL